MTETVCILIITISGMVCMSIVGIYAIRTISQIMNREKNQK